MIPHGYSTGDVLHAYREPDGIASRWTLVGDTQRGVLFSFEGYEPTRSPSPEPKAVEGLPVTDRLRNLTALIDAATKDRLAAMDEARTAGVGFSEIGRLIGMTGVGVKGVLAREFPDIVESPSVVERVSGTPDGWTQPEDVVVRNDVVAS